MNGFKFDDRYHDAAVGATTYLIATLPCGGELRGFTHSPPVKISSRCRSGERARDVCKGWIVVCVGADKNIALCPCVQEIREATNPGLGRREEEEMPARLGKAEGDLVDVDRDGANVDDADQDAALPAGGAVLPVRDPEPRPAPEEGMGGVEDAKGHPDERRESRDPSESTAVIHKPLS